MATTWQSIVDLWPTFRAFLAFAFGFSLLVFVHELGHFIVARWVGIKCTQFAVGMGQAVCSWRKGIGLRLGGTEREFHRRIAARLAEQGVEPNRHVASARHEDLPAASAQAVEYRPEHIDRAARELGLGDTEYRLNWMPLGGYVKMLGQEDLDPAARSNDPRAFNSQSVGARMAVISAGVIMNLVLGMVLLAWAFMIGVKFPTHIVGDVVPHSPAALAHAQGRNNDPASRGLRPGDVILSLDGDPVRDFLDLKLGVALAGADRTLDLEVRRPGETAPLHFLLKPTKGPDKLLSIGVEPTDSLDSAQVIDPDQPDAKPLILRLTHVQGQPVADYAAYVAAVTRDPLRPKTVTFTDEQTGRSIAHIVKPMPALQRTAEMKPADRRRHLLGMMPAVQIGAFAQDSPARQAGAREGDLIARLGDQAWPTIEQLRLLVAEADDKPLTLTVRRGEELIELSPVTPKKHLIGILTPLTSPVIAGVLPDSPAAALNLPPGSRIEQVNGRPVADWADLQQAFIEASPGPVTLTCTPAIVGRPTEQAAITLQDDDLASVRQAGWELAQEGFVLKQLEMPLKADHVLEAAALGLGKTRDFMVQAYLMLTRLIQGAFQEEPTIGIEHLSGPVGILRAGTNLTHERGTPYLLFFLGLLSVNLAVINFLPIPIVDGGHAVFLIIEKLKGSPVSTAVQAAATYVGLALIGLVFVVVTYNDIAQWVSP